MKTRINTSRSIAAVFFLSGLIGTQIHADTIDFEELSLSADSFFDGYGGGASEGTWGSKSAVFNTNQFGPGWSYSNVNDTTTPGFGNHWAAASGTGYGGSGIYAMANSLSPEGAFIDLPDNVGLLDVQVTNSTYAAISMRDGDAFGKQFGGATGNDSDFFRLTLAGYSGSGKSGTQTGSVEVYLADYRFADNNLDFILTDWTPVDLTSLRAARSISISFDGSDVGAFGLNTPAYVAIDNLRFSAVPEPGNTIVLTACLLTTVARRRKRA